MKICTLASGSSGNSLFIDTGKTRILVDAGISQRKLKARLKQIGSSLEEIDSVVVSHEHSDHTTAIPSLKNPIYVAKDTSHIWTDRVRDLREFTTSAPFEIGDVRITPFPVSHDAIDPVGFLIEADGKRIGVVTDIGYVTELVKERLSGSDALVIEFNHDERLLSYGPYPWELKQRIKSRHGHLSNVEAAGLLRHLIHDGLRYVVLAHLSKTNNSEHIAVDAALSVLIKERASRVGLFVAPTTTIGEVIEF